MHTSIYCNSQTVAHLGRRGGGLFCHILLAFYKIFCYTITDKFCVRAHMRLISSLLYKPLAGIVSAAAYATVPHLRNMATQTLPHYIENVHRSYSSTRERYVRSCLWTIYLQQRYTIGQEHIVWLLRTGT